MRLNAQDYLTDYYNRFDEDGRLQTRHGHVEFLTTMTYVEKYLWPGARILEIGAGTGRYSHALARMGYEVDAVELIERNIEIFRQQTRPEEKITIRQGTATDLSAIADNRYDLVLLLGPMYHLFDREEQKKALSEAIRTAKRGGVIFCAYCMADPSILQHGFIKGNIHNLVDNEMLDLDTFEAFSHPWDLFELYRKEKIEALRAEFDVQPLHFIAADGYANHMREALAAMDESNYQLYLKYHLTTCERQDMIGLSHHTLDIIRKK